jgi:hypothetical protein
MAGPEPFTPDRARAALARSKSPSTPLGSLVSPQAIAASQQEQMGKANPNAGELTAPLLEGAGSIAAAGLLHMPGALLGEEAAAAAGKDLAGSSLSPFLTRALEAGAGYMARSGLLVPAAAGGAVAGSEAAQGLSTGPPETPGQMLLRRMRAGFTGGLSELAAPPLHAVTGPIVSKVRGRFGGIHPDDLMEPYAAESHALIQSESGGAAGLLAGQARRGMILDSLENAVAYSIGGGGPIMRFKAAAGRAAIGALDRLGYYAEKLTPKEAGEMVDQIIVNSRPVQQALVRGAYRKMDDIGEQAGIGNQVNVSSVLRMAATSGAYQRGLAGSEPNAVAISQLLKPYLNMPGEAQILTAAGRPALAGLPISFAQAEELRSNLLAISRNNPGATPKVEMVAGALAKELDDQIDMAAKSLGPLGEEYRAAMLDARALAKMGFDQFDSEALGQTIGKSTPEQISAALFKSNATSKIEAVRNVLQDSRFAAQITDKMGKPPAQIWREIQGTYLAGLRRGAGESEYKAGRGIDGKALGEAIDQSEHGGAMAELFPDPVQRKSLRVAARALELSEADASRNRTGAIAIQLAQAGAAGTVAAGAGEYMLHIQANRNKDLGWAGAILLAPAVLAHVLASRAFSNFLIQRALTKPIRAGMGAADFLAQAMGKLTEMNVPFGFVHPDGTRENFVPGQTGPQPAQGSKPVSRF